MNWKIRQHAQILPVSTTTLGWLIEKSYSSYQLNIPNDNRTSFYRVALLMLEVKRLESITKRSMTSTSIENYAFPFLDFKVYSLIKAHKIHFPAVINFVNAYGNMVINNIHYYCDVLDIPETNPCTITIQNVRKYAEDCTKPSPSTQLMFKYKPFPFGDWVDGLLVNVDEIIPIGYESNCELIQRDLMTTTRYIMRDQSLWLSCEPVNYLAPGHSCALVSMNRFPWLENATDQNADNDIWTHDPNVSHEDFQFGGIIMLGFVCNEMKDHPAYMIRNKNMAIQISSTNFSGNWEMTI